MKWRLALVREAVTRRGNWLRFFAGFLFLIPACSDLGSGPGGAWQRYDLPNAEISLPVELVRQVSVAALPTNPIWSGSIDGRRFAVEACLYQEQFSFREYQELPITLSGFRGVLFCGEGFLHWYDSGPHRCIGVRIQFREDEDPLVIMIVVESSDNYEFARRILMTIRPRL